jgi:adenosylcobinamide amidohydrolase
MPAGPVGSPEPYGLGSPASRPELAFRVEAGRRWPMHVWRFGRPVRAISSGPHGGGLGERHWIINATVRRDYGRLDPGPHLAELAAELELAGPGTGMLTAVDVGDAVVTTDGGVVVVATVGLGHPTRAAAAAEPVGDTGTINVGTINVGTINVVALIPAPLSDAALVNAVATATEAKVQALADHGLDATGTATDALVLACPIAEAGVTEPFGGPRSTWGSRLARAVHAAVGEGARQWHDRTRTGRQDP